MIVFTLPLKLTNNNEGQSRHWSKANKAKQMFAKALLETRFLFKEPQFKQRITITRILGKGERLWDADSVLRGNAKQLIDALVDAGFFVDDGPKYISEGVGRQDDTDRANGPAIRIEIEKI